MAQQEVNPEGTPLMLDSESFAIMRQLYPGRMDSKDQESFLKEKANQALYKYAQKKRIALGANPYLNQMQMNPQVGELLKQFGAYPGSGGAAMPPNVGGVEGGLPVALLAGLVPGLVGSLISAVPQFIQMFRKKPRADDDGAGYTGQGAIAPPNVRRGGAAADLLQALIPAASRVEASAMQAKSAPEFFHNLGRSLKGEIPTLLSRYTRVAPEHVNFLADKLVSKMGLPAGFRDFIKQEVARIGAKVGEEAAPRVEKFSARLLGSGDGGSLKALAKPVIKWMLSKAMHKIGPVESVYKKAKDIMGQVQDVYEYTGKGDGGDGGAEECPGGRRKRPPKKPAPVSTVGRLARKVVGETLQKAAPTGSAMLGKAVDLIAEKFLGAPTSIGSDIAQTLGESVLRTTGELMTPEDEPEAPRRRVKRPTPAEEEDLGEEEPYASDPEEERYTRAIRDIPRGRPVRHRATKTEPAPRGRPRYPPPGRRQTAYEEPYEEPYEEEYYEPRPRTRRPVGRPRKKPEPVAPPPAPARFGAFPMGAGKKKAFTIRVL